MTRTAILFGLNYDRTPEARLRGCINDVRNMETYLKATCGFEDVRVLTDDRCYSRVTAQGILQELNNMARRTWSESLDVVWIHFSGHGCSVRDMGYNDELDGKDECLVPADFKTAGVVPDDYIKDCLRNFRPETRVIFVADCCHSGTIGDLRYRYMLPSCKPITENWKRPCPASIVMMSGCMDRQTSADAWNVNRMRKFSGAMTSCLLQVLKERGDNVPLFQLMECLRDKLREKHFTQVPQLTSSKLIEEKETLFN